MLKKGAATQSSVTFMHACRKAQLLPPTFCKDTPFSDKFECFARRGKAFAASTFDEFPLQELHLAPARIEHVAGDQDVHGLESEATLQLCLHFF